MKIGIDARFWSQTGVGRYIRNIVKGLSELDSKNEYIVYLLNEDLDKVNLPANFKKLGTSIRWHTFAEQFVLPLAYLRENLDILLVLNFNIPIFYPKKLLTTVHDLTLLRTRTGRSTRLPYALYLLKFFAGSLTHYLAVKRSKIIFTVSNYVKNDIVKTFNVSPQKIILTPNAVDESFYPRQEQEIDQVLNKYKVKRPYILYVGNACLHKNLWNLVQAFNLLSANFPNLTLLLGGKIDFNYENLKLKSSKLSCANKIVMTGFIDDNDLPALYSGASVFVNPSLYEGFGIQILEAFACGCKVACSNATSLPEVGGDLARYFDPKNVENMAQVIQKTMTEEIKDFLSHAQKILSRYSWKDSARAVYEAIQNL